VEHDIVIPDDFPTAISGRKAEEKLRTLGNVPIYSHKAKSLDLHPLRPQRFREGDLIYEPLTAFRD